MNDLEFLRDAAERDGLYPAFAGMVQTVVSAHDGPRKGQAAPRAQHRAESGH